MTLTDAAKDTMTQLFAWAQANPGKVSRRGNSRRTVAYIPQSHPAYQRFAAGLKPITNGGSATGVIVVEWLEPHKDALSVSGVYLAPTDELAPTSKVLWAVAGPDGSPNVEYVTRPDGALAKAMRQLW